jgi:hypothetical protein
MPSRESYAAAGFVGDLDVTARATAVIWHPWSPSYQFRCAKRDPQIGPVGVFGQPFDPGRPK